MFASRTSVINLLKQYKCDEYGVVHGHEVWLTPDKVIVRVPQGSQIHYDIVEIIAIDILGMGVWEFDYWIGQSCIN